MPGFDCALVERCSSPPLNVGPRRKVTSRIYIPPMHKMSPFLIVALSLVVAIGGCASHRHTTASSSASSAAAHANESEKGFVPIFNGKDLDGWVYGVQAGQGYRVRDGAIYSTVADG